ncbi:MAG: site-specific DNA-methyltransferase [Planctomycetes bacterium]|nr:site-specific DNA-methyltransferase [Planctomycetota bacterium]
MQDFHNKIICGNCIDILCKIDEPFADLIFADPPFNIGYKYDKYNDKVKKEKYLSWTKDWMSACKKALKPNGSFYIAIGDDYAANIKVIADELGLVMRNWLIWHYTFGQQMKNKFACSHTHIFYFVKDKNNFTFNDYAVRTPSDRQLLYNDKRANPSGKMPDDVWSQFSRVCGTFKERTGWHPCQMPENLLKRIVAVSSNEEDCVLDPFSGSGTTAAAAMTLGRNYIGIDISKEYVEKTNQRLAELENQIQNNPARCNIEELKRLLTDIKKPAKEIVKDKNLLTLFTNQFAVRTNNKTKYSQKEIAAVLEKLAN